MPTVTFLGIGDFPRGSDSRLSTARLTARDIFLANHRVAMHAQWNPARQERVREAITLAEHALKSLGNRSDPDRVGPWLRDLRDTARTALAAFESIGLEADGAGITPLFRRAHETHDAKVRAENALVMATGKDAIAARDAVTVADADDRDVWRKIGALVESAEPPVLPADLGVFKRAKGTAESMRGGECTAILCALQAGAAPSRARSQNFGAAETANADLEFRLLVCYLGGALYEWARKMWIETGVGTA